MDIAQYLADLLYTNDEVSIPGLGTLYKEKVAARFNPETNQFEPPSSQLLFTGTAGTDHLLNDHICSVKHISLSSAEFFSNRFGEELKQKLAAEGKADLSPVGWLEQSGSEVRLVTSNEFSDTSNFGFEPVRDPSKNTYTEPVKAPVTTALTEENEQEEGEIEPQPNNNDTGGESYRENATGIPAGAHSGHAGEDGSAFYRDDLSSSPFDRIILKEGSYDGEEEQEENGRPPKSTKRRKLIIITIALAIFITMMAAVAILYKQQIIDLYKKYAAPPAIVQPAPKKPVAPQVTLPDSLAIDSAGVVSDSTTAAGSKTGAEDGPSTVEIISGTFSDRAKAEAHIRELSAKGIQAKIVDDHSGRIKVSIGSYKDYIGALKDIQRVKNTIDSTAYYIKIPAIHH